MQNDPMWHHHRPSFFVHLIVTVGISSAIDIVGLEEGG
jgi:hypothetical protein